MVDDYVFPNSFFGNFFQSLGLIGFEAVEITAELTNKTFSLLLKLSSFQHIRQAFRFLEIMLVMEKNRKNLKNQSNL
ncbi:hypothetical protein LEP1GSC172_4011 [Leptospira noguchii]|uniref:Uncharacterized protein n=2 Tax=Leptospira noguchii TaxID=28182 RepID=T0FUW9_9LEPT|nr:hypothetical protein LEP1GSC172_4011 [Leptospira noguchii]EQA73330.1 hypothetical protein LEP1GSC059_0327 [Leptospira noguchii serovar Panama str. CZ214]